MALPAAGSRAVEGELRTAQADPGAQTTDEAPDRLRELRQSVPLEVVVVESTHPLAGCTLAVEGLRTVRGERCLLVRLPDGSAGAVALSATSVGGRGAPAGGGALLSPAGVRRLRTLLVAAGGDQPGT